MAKQSGNDLTLKVGFDIAKFQTELNKTTGILNKWHASTSKMLMNVSAGFAAITVGRHVLTSLAGFESEMSKVRAITNATNEEFSQLRNNAIELAKAYGFTTKEVATLQLEYGRLGFSTSEILNSSKAAILLSKATGEDLANAAIIAGSTLRSFNLDATEMNRVSDVMAAAFNKSALGLSDFGEAIKYVAPVAANAGLSIEQVSAMLGVLADNGIKGSMAGTSLRKIISDLGQGAAPVLTKRLAEMAASGLDGAEAMDEVGRTAYASLLILSKNTEKVNESTEAYKRSIGELQTMADLVQDNLLGDWAKFNGQLDATIQKGSGVISVLRGIVQAATGMVAVAGGDVAKPGKNWFLNALGIYPKENGASSTWEVETKKIEEKTQAIVKQTEAVKKLVDAEVARIKIPENIGIQTKTDLTVPENFDGTDQARVEAFKGMADAQVHLADKIRLVNEAMAQQKELFFQTAERAAHFGAQIGDTIGSGYADIINISKEIEAVLKKGGDATELMAQKAQMQVQVWRNVATDIVNELYRIAVAAVIKNATLFGGPAGVALAVAGLTALKALFSGIMSGGSRGVSGGGGGGGYSGGGMGYKMESLGQRIQLSGEVIADGRQLKIVLANQDRFDRRTSLSG